MTRAELVALIESKIQDQKPYLRTYGTSGTRGLSSTDFVSDLIDTLNIVLFRYAPRKARKIFAGADTRVYDIADAVADTGESSSVFVWLQDSSKLLNVWYPYDATEENREPLKFAYYALDKRNFGVDAETKDALVFTADTPESSEVIEVLFTTLHDIPSSGAITIPTEHVIAFADLVTGHYILSISSEFLQHVRDYITADVVSNLSPTSDAQSVALQFIKNFYNHFGVTVDNQQDASSGWVQWGRTKGKTFFHEEDLT